MSKKRQTGNEVISKTLDLDARTLGVSQDAEKNAAELSILREKLQTWLFDQGAQRVLTSGKYVIESSYGGNYPYVEPGTRVRGFDADLYHWNGCTITVKGRDLNCPFGYEQDKCDRNFEIWLCGRNVEVDRLESRIRKYLREDRSQLPQPF
ncbi:MAG TPA: hypothetical protein VJH22_07360 [Candidatus Nanoarchaeia archaeon]|nr:hypothetical protein [Candidatus Nanoarchaeia archaeon]